MSGNSERVVRHFFKDYRYKSEYSRGEGGNNLSKFCEEF